MRLPSPFCDTKVISQSCLRFFGYSPNNSRASFFEKKEMSSRFSEKANLTVSVSTDVASVSRRSLDGLLSIVDCWVQTFVLIRDNNNAVKATSSRERNTILLIRLFRVCIRSLFRKVYPEWQDKVQHSLFERFESSEMCLEFHFLPDFSKDRDLVEDITGRR